MCTFLSLKNVSVVLILKAEYLCDLIDAQTVFCLELAIQAAIHINFILKYV